MPSLRAMRVWSGRQTLAGRWVPNVGRKRCAKNIPLSPWLSGNVDCRDGRFIQVGNSLFLSKAFQALSSSAQVLYLFMTMEAAGKSVVRFSHGAAKKYGIAGSTFDRAIKQLRDSGFVQLIEDDIMSQFSANEFRFVMRWKSKPAPHFGER